MNPLLIVVFIGILGALLILIFIRMLSLKPEKTPVVRTGKKYISVQHQSVQIVPVQHNSGDSDNTNSQYIQQNL